MQVVVELVEILVGKLHRQHQQVVLVVEELEVLLVQELLEHFPLVVVAVVEHMDHQIAVVRMVVLEL